MNAVALLIAGIIGAVLLAGTQRTRNGAVLTTGRAGTDSPDVPDLDMGGVSDDPEDPPTIVVNDEVETDDGEVVDEPRVVTEAQAEAEQPAVVPKDTAQLVAYLLGRENEGTWKSKEPRVKSWQRSHEDIDGERLVDDGMFGPKTALSVASESGVVPIVRFWPKGSQPQDVLPEYEATLHDMAAAADDDGDSARAAQLRASAQRERGQGFGPKPPEDIVELDFDSMGDVDLETM